MGEKLFAVVGLGGGGELVCADCATEDDLDNENHTPVYESDDWKSEVSGICVRCGELVQADDDDAARSAMERRGR